MICVAFLLVSVCFAGAGAADEMLGYTVEGVLEVGDKMRPPHLGADPSLRDRYRAPRQHLHLWAPSTPALSR